MNLKKNVHSNFPALLLMACLGLTVGAALFTRSAMNEKARIKFEHEWKGIQAKIQTRADVYIKQLYAGRGLFAASISVERNEWAAFTRKQRLTSQFAGIFASGFVEIVPHSQLDSFIQSVREDKSVDAQGYPTFDVHPKSEKENYAIVKYIEPFESNRKVFGYDMFSEPVRADALRRAAETGEAAATRKIQLVQDPTRAGFILILPIYKNDMPASKPSERLSALQGFVADTIDANTFFRHDIASSQATTQIDFEIFDSADMKPEHLLFDFDDSLHAVDPNYKARFSVNVPMTIGGQAFMMHCTAPRNFGLGERQEWLPFWVLGAGILVSFFFFYLMRILAYGESKALQCEAEKTREMKLLLDSSTDGIYGINLKGQCTFINSSALQMLGYKHDELIGRNIRELSYFKKMDGQPYPLKDCPIDKAFKSGACCRVKDQVLWRKDGKSFPVEYSASPIIEGGKILGSLCTFKDITEAKKTAEILKQKQDELFDFVENSNVCMHWIGADGTILWANKTEIELLGYSQNEYIGQNISKFHADENVICDILQRLMRCEKLDQYEARLRAKDGSIKIVVINSSAYIKDGQFIHTRCFTQDITEKKKRDEENARLMVIQKQFGAIVESSEDAIVAKDLNGIITSWNKSAERIFGYSEHEAIGRPMAMLIPPDRQSEDSEILSKIARGECIQHFETVRVKKDGTPVDVSVTISPMRDESGRIFGASKIVRDITVQKLRDKERQKLLEQLDAQKKGLDQFAIVAETDAQGRITYVNDQFCNVSKYTREELIGQDHRLVNSGYHPKSFFKDMWATIGSGRLWHGEVRNRAKDGSFYWVDTSIVPFMNSEGKPEKYLSIRVVITERKMFEEKLVKAAAEMEILHQAAGFATRDLSFEEALQETLAIVCRGIHSPVGHVYKASPDGRGMVSTGIWFLEDAAAFEPVKYATENMCFQTGVGLPGIIAQTGKIAWVENIPTQDFLRKDACRRSGLKAVFGFPITVEGKVVAVLEFFSRLEGKPSDEILRLADNLSKQLQAVFDRKRTQEAIEASRIQLQAILDSATEVSIIATDTTGIIKVFNKGAENMLGWKSEEMVGLKTPEVIHLFEEVSERGKKIGMQTGKAVEGFEVFVADARAGKPQLNEWTYVRKDGSHFPVSLYITGVYDSKNRLSGFLGIATDITRIKNAEKKLLESAQQAQAASRAKSDFLATMSHEIRTPMNAILGMMDLLSETALTEEQRDYVARLSRGGETLLSIINDILDLSKIEAGSMEIERIEFDFFEVVGKTVDLLALKAHQKGLRLHFQMDPSIPRVLLSDPTRLRQILLNLLNNAIKFTPQGEILLKVTRGISENETKNGLTLHFSVIDTGMGIPKQKFEKLFEPFSQADSSTTRKFGGTGLGLNICKRLVELMGGQIGVQSEEGKGSCFYFDLPFGISKALPAQANEDSVSIPNTTLLHAKDNQGMCHDIVPAEPVPVSCLRILVADDSAENQYLIQAFLKKEPYKIDFAENGKVAFEKSSRCHYDLILMDMQMPEMDGYTATRLIRAREAASAAKQRVLIIALTANALRDDAQKCLEAGCDRYLSKPIKKNILCETLHSISMRNAA